MAGIYTTDNQQERARVDRYVEDYTSPGMDGQLSEEEQQQQQLENKIFKVQALGQALIKTRTEAMTYRQNIGIETDWQEDEEYYQSIDSANPEGETNVGKPLSSEGGPVGIPDTLKGSIRSTIFIPLTRPYVDAANAKVADMLLPNDEWPFDFTTTPIPTQAEARAKMGQDMIGGDQTAVSKAIGMLGPRLSAAAQGAPMPQGPMAGAGMVMGGAAPAAAAGPAAPAPESASPNAPDSAPVTDAQTSEPGAGGDPSSAGPAGQPDPGAIPGTPAADSMNKTPEEISCERAKQYITDWLVECQFHSEYRKMLENCAKLGTGVLKGPVPFLRVSQKMVRAPDGSQQLVRVEEIVPISCSIDPRNLYPDPGCGEDIQRGSYVWEYDTMSARKVTNLASDPSYIGPQIAKVLRAGPIKNGVRPNSSPQANVVNDQLTGSTFEVWYFHGMVDADTLECAGIEPSELPPAADTLEDGSVDPDAPPVLVPAIVTMINDEVVKCSLTPMDGGGFPYDVMPWQRRAGMIWGMGVARQMRAPQRMLNGAARAMMDNAAFTSGPIMGIRSKWIKMAGGGNPRAVMPRMLLEMSENAPENAKIGDAISVTNITAAQAEMEKIIDLAIHLAEVATGLPMILQGQQDSNPETATGRTIQNNNGSAVLRRIARQSDDCVMERHIRRYYQWLLENTDYDDAKGDLQIECSASTALVDREISNQTLVQMAPMLYQDPDISRTRLNQEMLRAHRFDPKRIYKTAAERRQDAINAKNAPPPLPIWQQMVRNEGAAKVATINAASTERLGMADLEQALHTTLAQIAQLREANTNDNRTKLADTVAKLQTQMGLSQFDAKHDGHQQHVDRVHEYAMHHTQALTAPTEPAGRAPAGEAFEA